MSMAGLANWLNAVCIESIGVFDGCFKVGMSSPVDRSR